MLHYTKEPEMTKKDRKKIDDIIGYLSESSDRIQSIRQVTNINPQYSFTREASIIEYHFFHVLNLRKKCQGTLISSSSSGWTVNYIRQHKKYKKDEEYCLNIYFSFVDADTYD